MRTHISRVLGALAASAALVTGLAGAPTATAAAAPAAQAAAACHRHHVIAYVTGGGPGAGYSVVTPVDTVTGKTFKPIPAGSNPTAVVVTPDGKTAYVANQGSATVTPSSPPAWSAGGTGQSCCVLSQARAPMNQQQATFAWPIPHGDSALPDAAHPTIFDRLPRREHAEGTPGPSPVQPTGKGRSHAAHDR